MHVIFDANWGFKDAYIFICQYLHLSSTIYAYLAINDVLGPALLSQESDENVRQRHDSVGGYGGPDGDCDPASAPSLTINICFCSPAITVLGNGCLLLF